MPDSFEYISVVLREGVAYRIEYNEFNEEKILNAVFHDMPLDIYTLAGMRLAVGRGGVECAVFTSKELNHKVHRSNVQENVEDREIAKAIDPEWRNTL